jgi:excisionase family DNA binding protein
MAEKTRAKYRRLKPNTKKVSGERATLSPRESTKYTGIGVTATYDLLHKKLMPAIQVGNRFYIPVAALRRWLENAGE